MKPFKELTNEELVALSDEQIQRYIDLAKAEAGIKFLLPVSLLDVKPVPTPKTTFYINRTLGIACEVSEPIQRIISLIQQVMETGALVGQYKYESLGSGQYDYMIMPFNTGWDEMVSSKIYHKEEVANIKSTIAENKRAIKEHDEAVEIYNREMAAEHGIIDEIYSTIREASDFLNNVDYYYNLFVETYYPLAENNYNIAYNFLFKAYPNMDSEVKKEVINRIDNGYNQPKQTSAE